MINYINFDLEIGSGSNRRYPVVVKSPVGEARATLRFPFSETELEACLVELEQALLNSYEVQNRLPSLDEREEVVQTFGQLLFEAVMVGDVRGRYEVCRHEVQQKGMGLRIGLRVQAAELAVLPWELLFDSSRTEFLCLSQYTPIMRYTELPQPGRPLRVTPPLRILGLVANPRNQEHLDVGREKRRLQEALRELEAAGLVQLTWLEGQTWRGLQQTLRQGPWHIFHFIGHAEFDAKHNEGYIALVNEDQYTHRLSATQLATLLVNQPEMQLVLLNACRGAQGSQDKLVSSTAAVLARRGIPAVLGMQYDIRNGTAIEFTRSFYQALADELPLDAGVAEGRVALHIATPGQLEWATPVLYMRSSDAVLFDLGRPTQEASSSRAQTTSDTSTRVRPQFGGVSPEDAEELGLLKEDGKPTLPLPPPHPTRTEAIFDMPETSPLNGNAAMNGATAEESAWKFVSSPFDKVQPLRRGVLQSRHLLVVALVVFLVVTGLSTYIYVSISTHVRPGGEWSSPLNEQTVGRVVHFAAYAYPTYPDESAIDHVNFTAWWPGVDPRKWKIVCIAQPPAPNDLFTCDADFRLLGAVPGMVRISFDVYDQRGNTHLAPNGEHTITYAPQLTFS